MYVIVVWPEPRWAGVLLLVPRFKANFSYSYVRYSVVHQYFWVDLSLGQDPLVKITQPAAAASIAVVVNMLRFCRCDGFFQLDSPTILRHSIKQPWSIADSDGKHASRGC